MNDGGLASDGAAIACRKCGFAASRNYCAECGARLLPGRASLRAVRLMFAPLFDYVESARALLLPARVIEDIRAGRFGWGEALAFWLAATAIAALINAVLARPSLSPVDLPILDEVVEALMVIAVLIAMYSPLHPLLNRGGRGVSYGAFVVATLAIGALLYPWLALAQGVLAAFKVADPVGWTTPVTMFFFVRTYAALYRRGWAKTLAWVLGYFVLVVVVLMMAAGASGVGVG